ncbi:hypothetical protein [Pseudomonas synxantha]|uniref:hypothetical protein n=1 Tax=Pseudomonas synxantha TaxID=47883 RepID=UPI00099D4872|nr:hypothetical protein [Pseudomonas synxantha]OPB02362.1 hypothetical protein BFW89_15105 [Pseudomonas synxantha]
MISNHLSLVEALRPASDELAAQVEQYLAAGGNIEVAEPIGYKPKPITYSNQMPPTPKPFVRRRIEAAPLPPHSKDVRQQERDERAERIRELGATHTQTEASVALSLSRRTLYSIAKEYGITFKKSTRGGANDAARSEQVQTRDAKYAERIRTFPELGITRRQCCGRLAIGNKAFERIIAAHGIDYPKARQGCTSCAA